MIKSFWFPLLVVLGILFGIDWIADTLKNLVLALLPDAFEKVTPVAEFLQLPINSIVSAVASVKEFISQFIFIFTGLFKWIFSDGTFEGVVTAFLLCITAFITFVAYSIVGLFTLVIGIFVIILGLVLSLFSWIL
jgi:hypothetical protein